MLDAMFKVCFTESFDSQHFVETSSKPSFASPVGRYPFHLFLAVFRDWLLSFLITWNSSSTWKERRLESSSPLVCCLIQMSLRWSDPVECRLALAALRSFGRSRRRVPVQKRRRQRGSLADDCRAFVW